MKNLAELEDELKVAREAYTLASDAAEDARREAAYAENRVSLIESQIKEAKERSYQLKEPTIPGLLKEFERADLLNPCATPAAVLPLLDAFRLYNTSEPDDELWENVEGELKRLAILRPFVSLPEAVEAILSLHSEQRFRQKKAA